MLMDSSSVLKNMYLTSVNESPSDLTYGLTFNVKREQKQNGDGIRVYATES